VVETGLYFGIIGVIFKYSWNGVQIIFWKQRKRNKIIQVSVPFDYAIINGVPINHDGSKFQSLITWLARGTGSLSTGQVESESLQLTTN